MYRQPKCFFLSNLNRIPITFKIFSNNSTYLVQTPNGQISEILHQLKTLLISIIAKFNLLFFIAMLDVNTLNFAFHQKHGLVTLEHL